MPAQQHPHLPGGSATLSALSFCLWHSSGLLCPAVLVTPLKLTPLNGANEPSQLATPPAALLFQCCLLLTVLLHGLLGALFLSLGMFRKGTVWQTRTPCLWRFTKVTWGVMEPADVPLESLRMSMLPSTAYSYQEWCHELQSREFCTKWSQLAVLRCLEDTRNDSRGGFCQDHRADDVQVPKNKYRSRPHQTVVTKWLQPRR